MRVGFGNDHVAVELKNVLMEHLREKGYECIDFGPSDPADKVNYRVWIPFLRRSRRP